MSNVQHASMLEAGVHFGHQTRFWHPRCARIFLRAQPHSHHQSREDATAL